MSKPLFIALGILAIAGPSLAASQPPTAVVRYDDLDLTAPGDARTMLGRIRKAAAQACGLNPLMQGNDIAAIELFEACRADTLARAVRQLDAPEVTAAFKGGSERRLLARLP
jgi:UrcA family protein